MGLTSESSMRDRLEDYLQKARPPGVVSAYLFGSHGRGRAHRESDVDVGVVADRQVFPEGSDRFDLRLRLSADLIHALGVNDVDVVVLNDAPPLFAREVLARGARLLCTSEDRDRDFRRDVQLRAADLAPFLERHRRTKLDALAR